MPVINSGGGYPQSVDITDCAATLRLMYNAYIETVTGQRVQQVQTADFRTMMHQATHDLVALVGAYNSLRAACPGATSDLPERLSNPKLGTARRGPPVEQTSMRHFF